MAIGNSSQSSSVARGLFAVSWCQPWIRKSSSSIIELRRERVGCGRTTKVFFCDKACGGATTWGKKRGGNGLSNREWLLWAEAKKSSIDGSFAWPLPRSWSIMSSSFCPPPIRDGADIMVRLRSFSPALPFEQLLGPILQAPALRILGCLNKSTAACLSVSYTSFTFLNWYNIRNVFEVRRDTGNGRCGLHGAFIPL